MNYSKTISHINGNGNKYTLEIPTVMIIGGFGNEVAEKWFKKQTGLEMVKKLDCVVLKPKTFKQLYKIFATYNWKTTFYNNASYKNTLMLRHNHDQD